MVSTYPKDEVFILRLPGKGPMIALDTDDTAKRSKFLINCQAALRSSNGNPYWGFYQIGSHTVTGLAAWELWGQYNDRLVEELRDQIEHASFDLTKE
jgi:hypothetical protein